LFNWLSIIVCSSPHYEFVHPLEEKEEITAVDGLALLPGNSIGNSCLY